MGDANLECESRGLDQHRRQLAVCFLAGDDLNRIMVEQGWAIAYREFSYDYVAAELRARDYGLGLWSSQFAAPSEFRIAKNASVKQSAKGSLATPERQAKAARVGCVIKGNRNRRGEWIYHLPGMPYYEQTRAEEIFCSEDEAWAAGYRRARVRS